MKYQETHDVSFQNAKTANLKCIRGKSYDGSPIVVSVAEGKLTFVFLCAHLCFWDNRASRTNPNNFLRWAMDTSRYVAYVLDIWVLMCTPLFNYKFCFNARLILLFYLIMHPYDSEKLSRVFWSKTLLIYQIWLDMNFVTQIVKSCIQSNCLLLAWILSLISNNFKEFWGPSFVEIWDQKMVLLGPRHSSYWYNLIMIWKKRILCLFLLFVFSYYCVLLCPYSSFNICCIKKFLFHENNQG